MDNGIIPVDTQPPADDTAPISPAVTGPGEPGTPAPVTGPAATPAPEPQTSNPEAAPEVALAEKLGENASRLPLLTVVLYGLAAIGAFSLVSRGRSRRRLSL